MRKKLIIIVVLCLLAAFSCVLLSGCDDGAGAEPKLIVFLGDSIGAGIAGMSPLTERENYAYYGVIGLCNEYTFINRANGGHTTGKMLEYIQGEDGFKMTNTYIRQADILHVSILGNDFLLSGVGEIMLDIVEHNDYSLVNSIIAEAEENFGQIIDLLKEYNPDATLMVQTVYNPIFQDWIFIEQETKDKLDITDEQFRATADMLLEMLNDIIFNYLEENPDSYYVIDAYKEFNRIYKENSARGRALVFSDDVHPSTEGHAVISNLIQAQLEQLQLADKDTALRNYKALRKDQLTRLYATTINVGEVSAQIDSVATFEQLTTVYFNAIRGVAPIYY